MRTFSAVSFIFVIFIGCQNQFASGQFSIDNDLETSMRSVARAQYVYAQNLINEFLVVESVLTRAAELFLFRMRYQLRNDNVIIPFLTQVQNNLQSAPQLISTYSPSNIMDQIMSRYETFLRMWTFYLNIPGANQNLKQLYESKIPNSNAQTCWDNYVKTSNETYSAAVRDFIKSSGTIINGVHQQIEPVRNEIRQEIFKIAGLFTTAALFPTIRLPVLTQYIQTNGEAINSQISTWIQAIEPMMSKAELAIKDLERPLADLYREQVGNIIAQANDCLNAA
jgi:hypothetical protein